MQHHEFDSNGPVAWVCLWGRAAHALGIAGGNWGVFLWK